MKKIRLVKQRCEKSGLLNNDVKNQTYLREKPHVGNKKGVYPRIKINEGMPKHILRRRHCR